MEKSNFLVGLSTIHDAFCRYQARLFQNLYLALLKVVPVRLIEEFQELSPIVFVDSSIFPIAISAIWAEFKNVFNEIEQHLPIQLQLLDAVKAIFFQVTDELIRFDSVPCGRTYHCISFRTGQSFDFF